MTTKTTTFIIAMLFSIIPMSTFANVVIVEVLCNPVGKDSDGEWVKIQNIGNESIDLAGWKFNDGKNHILNAPPKNGGTGSLTIASGEVVLLANKAGKVSGANTIIDTVMSLSNKGEILQLINSDGTVVHEVSYNKSDVSEGKSCFNYDANATSTESSTTTTSSTSTKESTVTGSTTTEPVIIYNPIVTTVVATTTRIETEVVRHNIVTSVHKTTEYSFETIKIEPAPALNTRLSVPAIALIDTPVYIHSESSNAIGRRITPECRMNLGDGSTERVCSATHSYDMVGEYAIKLTTSRNGLRSEVGTKVQIIEPELRLSTLAYGYDDWAIVIHNDGVYTVELTNWELKWGRYNTTLPEGTLVLAGGELKLTKRGIGNEIKEDNELTLQSEHHRVSVHSKSTEEKQSEDDAKILEQNKKEAKRQDEVRAQILLLQKEVAMLNKRLIAIRNSKAATLALYTPVKKPVQKRPVAAVPKVQGIAHNTVINTPQVLQLTAQIPQNTTGVFTQLLSYIGL